MTKEEFLKRLKSKLSILDESEVIDILDEYSEHIDEKIKEGSSEKEAIKEFGDINELASDILSAYKANKNYSEDKVNSFIDDVIKTSKEAFNKAVKILSHGTFSDILKLAIYIIIILLIIAVLRIPFELLEGVLNRAFNVLPNYLEDFFDIVLSVVINFSYILVGAVFFVKMLKEKLLDSYEEETEVVKETETKKKTKNSNKKDDVIVEKQVEKKIVYKNSRTFLDSVGDLILIIIKVLVSFILIPSIIGIVFSSVGIASLILFAFKYYFFIGPIIVCIGLLTGCIWLTELIFRFIANKSGSFMKSFITFVVALVLCGIGIGVTLIEFSNLDYTSSKVETKITETYNFNVNNISEVTCSSCKNINKIIDNEMEDGTYTINVYSTEFQMPHYEVEGDNNEKIYFYYHTNDALVFKSIFEDIKEGKIMDYENTDNSLSLEIIGNENTLNKILTNKQVWE